MSAKISEKPRYLLLSEELQRRIEAGAFKIGDLLPTEIELCEEFDVSRYTVREALRKLTEAGFLQRRQGSGSQVIAIRRPASYLHSMHSLNELFQYATDTHLDILTMQSEIPDAKFGSYLGKGADSPWLVLEAVRRASRPNTPICFSIVFINDRFAEIAPDLPTLNGAIYTLLENRYGVEVADVEQEIRAEPIPRAAARALGCSVRLWAARVTRRYIDSKGGIMLVSINYHRGDNFSYTMHLKREEGRKAVR